MNDETNQHGQPAPNAIEPPARAKPRRNLCGADLREVAAYVSRGLTETEACHRLGIKPRTFWDFKSRCNRTGKFAELLEIYRAMRVESLIDLMEKSAKGEGLKFRDWRAAHALLKFLDSKRFGDSPVMEMPVNVNVSLTQQLMPEYMRMADKIWSQRKQVAQNPPKQLPPPPPEPQDGEAAQ